MRKIISAFSSLLVIALFISLVMLYVLPFFGTHVYCVKNENMAPEYSTGDVVYSRPVALYELNLNDVIICTTANNGDQLMRVYAINKQTQVIAVNIDASPKDVIEIRFATIIGRESFKIPCGAETVEYMHTPSGKLIAGCAMIAIFGMRLVLSDKKVKGNFR